MVGRQLPDALPVHLDLLREGLLQAAGLLHPLQRLQLLAEDGVALLQHARPVDVAGEAAVELLEALPSLDGGDARRGVLGLLVEHIGALVLLLAHLAQVGGLEHGGRLLSRGLVVSPERLVPFPRLYCVKTWVLTLGCLMLD